MTFESKIKLSPLIYNILYIGKWLRVKVVSEQVKRLNDQSGNEAINSRHTAHGDLLLNLLTTYIDIYYIALERGATLLSLSLSHYIFKHRFWWYVVAQEGRLYEVNKGPITRVTHQIINSRIIWRRIPKPIFGITSNSTFRRRAKLLASQICANVSSDSS